MIIGAQLSWKRAAARCGQNLAITECARAFTGEDVACRRWCRRSVVRINMEALDDLVLGLMEGAPNGKYYAVAPSCDLYEASVRARVEGDNKFLKCL